jgi:hypothetical protein
MGCKRTHTPAEFEGGPKKGTLATLRQERVLRGSGFRTQKPTLLRTNCGITKGAFPQGLLSLASSFSKVNTSLACRQGLLFKRCLIRSTSHAIQGLGTPGSEDRKKGDATFWVVLLFAFCSVYFAPPFGDNMGSHVDAAGPRLIL